MSSNKLLYKIGGIAAILGAIGNTVGNSLHPATLPSSSGQDRLLEVAHNPLWYPTHVTILLSVLCFTIAFFALYQYLLEKNANKTFAQLGLLFALIGTAVSCVLLPIDGFTIKRAALAWTHSMPQTKEIMFHDAAMLEQIDLDLFSMFLLLYYGVTFVFLGLASWQSSLTHRKWHLIPVIGGAILIPLGLYQLLFTAQNWTIAVWIPIWAINAIWLGVMGILMLRES